MATKKANAGRWAITTWIYLVVLVVVFPFYWMLVLSTHSNDDIYSFPPPLLPSGDLLANWERLLDVVALPEAFANSVLVATGHTAFVLVVSSLVGFGFVRFHRAPGATWMWRFVLATIFIPPTVGLIPWYLVISRLGWIDTLWPMIIPGAANGFAVFWMRQIIMQTVPEELYESARIDGASDWRTFATVVIPLIRPGLGALGIWTFMNAWTSFQIPLIVLNSRDKFTLPLAMANLNTQYSSDTAAVMLGSVVSVLPIFIAFVLAGKQFMAGLTAGALKG